MLESSDIVAQRDEARAAVADAQANLQKISTGTLPTDVEKARGQVTLAEAALNQADKNHARRAELYKQGAIPGRDLLASETDLKQAQASYDVARRTLDLLEHQSREQDIRIAESQVEQAKARLATVEAQLRFAEIRSPFAGTVTDQFMYPGDLAKPDTPIFTVMDLSVAVARAQVPETQAGSIRAGQPCSFASSDASAGAATGQITVVSRAVDPAKRTVEVWCEIANPERRLRAGAFGSVASPPATRRIRSSCRLPRSSSPKGRAPARSTWWMPSRWLTRWTSKPASAPPIPSRSPRVSRLETW